MGCKLGPNYACLFVEEQMLRDYTGIKPDLYKRYMDDVAGAASCTEDDLTQFLTFASNYHPKLEYTWSISSAKLPFLDMYLIPRDDRVATSIYYKETDSQFYLNFKSSHPFKCQYQQANSYDCGTFAARMTTSKKQQPPWSLSLSRVVIQSHLYRDENARQPLYQELFY